MSTFTVEELNFAALETRGVDYEVSYQFSLDGVNSALAGDALIRVVGNYTDQLDRFEDPSDPTIVNPELYENGQPKHVVNFDGRWTWKGLTLNWQSRYYSRFLEITPRLQIENADQFLNAWTGEIWRHDLSARYDISERLSVFGGVNNVTDRRPIASDVSYPVGIIGRQFFLGVDLTL